MQAYPIGTIRTWKDGKKYKKTAKNEWVLISEPAAAIIPHKYEGLIIKKPAKHADKYTVLAEAKVEAADYLYSQYTEELNTRLKKLERSGNIQLDDGVKYTYKQYEHEKEQSKGVLRDKFDEDKFKSQLLPWIFKRKELLKLKELIAKVKMDYLITH